MQIPLARIRRAALRYANSKVRTRLNNSSPREGEGKTRAKGGTRLRKALANAKLLKINVQTRRILVKGECQFARSPNPVSAISTACVRNFYVAFYARTRSPILFNSTVHGVLLAPACNGATQDEIAAYLMGL